MLRRNAVVLAGIVALALALAIFAFSRARREGFAAERGCVLVVEPRKHENLEAALDAFLGAVPAEYDTLFVYHGKGNGAFAREAAKAWTDAGKRVVFKSLGVDNLDADSYNALFKRKEFWEGIDREKILVVQTDAVPCAASPHRLGEFEKFGYIGSSYGADFPTGRSPDVWGGRGYYGVGGLSFRRKSFCIKCCERGEKAGDDGAEDVFFSECVADFDYPKPTAADLANFATQNSFDAPSFGAHQINKQLDPKQKDAFFAYCSLARIT